MRKFLVLTFAIALMMVSSSCSNNGKVADVAEGVLDKEGVGAYSLTQDNEELLRALNLDEYANIVSFKAPKTAQGVEVKVYVLDPNGEWKSVGGFIVYLNKEDGNKERLEGTFSMILNEDSGIDMNINTSSTRFSASIRKEDYPKDAYLDQEDFASAKAFLDDFQKMELNKEIPVAIMVEDSNDIRSFSLESFFSTDDFEEMDFVRAVTLTFLDDFN